MSAEPAGAKKKRGLLREILTVVLPALAVAVAVQSFVVKAFRIPSESMLPTLLVGDYLFVSKYAYGYSRYSLPLSLPLFSGRIFAAEPKRGDVLVFRLPADDTVDYIKRVVGLPGDTVQMRGGVLHLNGAPVERMLAGDFLQREEGITLRIDRYLETLPEGASYMTLDIAPDSPLDDTPAYRVPAGHYFVIGDNRDDSTDSRVPEEVGMVPFENIVGRAEFIFFSVADGAAAYAFWRWPWTVRGARLFQAIR